MEPVQSTVKIRTKARQLTRQRRREEKQGKKRTPAPCANGFLRQSFVPVTLDTLPANGKIKLIENGFFNSLENLSKLYEFSPLDVSGKVYPLNIHFAFQHAEAAIHERDKSLHLIIVNDETHLATLATAKTMENGLTPFYIPAEPLNRLIESKENTQVINLLLSAFTYLHLVAGMPFCDNSFIGYTYDMIDEWIKAAPEEWDKDEYKEKIADLRMMYRGIKQLKKQIIKPMHLNRFKDRLQSFIPGNKKEDGLCKVVHRLFDLWQAFPSVSLFDSIHPDLLYPEKEERIMPDEYFSFYWHAEGWLYEDLMENVNMTLQEKEVSEDPAAIQFFDTPQTKPLNDLQYVTELFDIIWELAGELNDF